MRKFVWAAVLFCAAAVAALPYWAGLRTEQAYRAAAAEWSQPGQFTLEVQTYRRGWLRSEAELLLTVAGWPPPASAEGAEVGAWAALGRWVQEDRIGHGPLPMVGSALGVPGLRPAMAVVDSRVRLAEAPAGVAASLGEEPLAETRTVVAWDGSARSVVRGRPLEVGFGEAGTLLWQGLGGTLECSLGGRVLGSLTAPGVAWGSAGAGVTVDAVTVSFDLARDVQDLILGEYRVEAARMAVEASRQEAGRLEGIAVSSSAVAAGDLVHAATTVDVKGVTTGGETYGPVSLRLAATNLDAVTLARWQALAVELQSRVRGPEELPAFLEDRFRALAPAFLARSPQLELTSLRVGTTEGEVTATGVVSFQGEGPVSLEDLQGLLGRVRAEARVSVPEGMARQIVATQVRQQVLARSPGERTEPSEEEVRRLSQAAARQQLESLVAQRLLEFDGRAYSCGLRWSAGSLAVNGRPMDPGGR